MTKRTASPDVRSEPTPSPRLKYIHPVDLLEYRLGTALEEASNLVEVTLDNFVLRYEKRDDGHTRCTSTRRDDAYCDPYKGFYPRARRALELVRPAAIGISEWLRWGVKERAGTFETELRAALTDMQTDAYDFPNLPLYPVLKSRYARWERNLSRAWELHAELGNVAVESRDPSEWHRALHDALKAVRPLDEAFAAYGSAAEDQTADLTTYHAALVAAMDPVKDNLVKIGPRLMYAFEDCNDVHSLVEHLPHWLAQCAGNLPNWRRHDCDIRGSSQEISANHPSDFMQAWHLLAELGELVLCALGEHLPEKKDSLKHPKAKRRQRVGRAHHAGFARAREDTIAEAIRSLASDGRPVTSMAISEKCTGSDGQRIPEGTVRGSEAWKGREDIIAKVGGDMSYMDRYRTAGAYASDQTPFDETESSTEP